jgi:hypothetical protein
MNHSIDAELNDTSSDVTLPGGVETNSSNSETLQNDDMTIRGDSETIHSDDETFQGDDDNARSTAYSLTTCQAPTNRRDSSCGDEEDSTSGNDHDGNVFPKVYFKKPECLCGLAPTKCQCRFGFLLGAGLIRNIPRETDTEVWAITRPCGCAARSCRCTVSELLKAGILRCKKYTMAKHQHACQTVQIARQCEAVWPPPLSFSGRAWVPPMLKEDMIMDWFREVFMRSSAWHAVAREHRNIAIETIALACALDSGSISALVLTVCQTTNTLMDYKMIMALVAACRQLRILYWMGQKYMLNDNMQPSQVDAMLGWLQGERVAIAKECRLAYQAAQSRITVTGSSGGDVERAILLRAGGQRRSILNHVIDIALDMSGLKILMS